MKHLRLGRLQTQIQINKDSILSLRRSNPLHVGSREPSAMTSNSNDRQLLQEFFHLFNSSVNTDFSIPLTDRLATIDIKQPLRGLGSNFVAVIDDTRMKRDDLNKALNKSHSYRTILFVVALNDSVHLDALTVRATEKDRLVVLNLRDIRAVVDSPRPKDELLKYVRQQISYLALVPFEVSSPAFGSFFFGRVSELRRLNSNQDYAICGPGGMGKSSLLRHFIWLRRLTDRNAFDRTVEVDLMGVPEPDVAACLITAAIQRKTSVRIEDSEKVTVRRFSEVSVALHRAYAKRSSSAPFHLVLDEVGSLIEVDRRRTLGDYFQRATASGLDKSPFPFLQTLRKLASDGVFRLTLCSRTETRELLQHPMNPFGFDGNYSRLRLLEIGRLHDHEAEKMLTEPLRALGVDVGAYRGRIDDALRKAGGIPFQLADYGLDIALDAEPANVPGSIQRKK
jgi:hypothetical protein